MKEIGQCFKEARESIELSKEEVLRDLNISESQLDNLEDGNANAFKDIFFLKDLIKKYAIYLNLDEDEIMNKFNDFIFGYTSRIPVSDILEKTREMKVIENKQEENKVVSPYTSPKKTNNYKYIVIYLLSVIVMIILIILIVHFIKNSNVDNLSIVFDEIERRF